MKKTLAAAMAAILMVFAPAALADDGIAVTVARIDGASAVMLVPETPEDIGGDDGPADLILPRGLVTIEEEAFAGIAAKSVEILENVSAIASRAFAGNALLEEITIPAGVTSISDDALDGCGNVTIYGTRGTEAEAFAQRNGFTFIDRAEPTPTPIPLTFEQPPVPTPGPLLPDIVLPFTPVR